MPRFWFALCRGENIRGTGTLTASSLCDALRSVSRRGAPVAGDSLEIGLEGFPPARYECVFRDFDTPLAWQLVNRMAA